MLNYLPAIDWVIEPQMKKFIFLTKKVAFAT
jgi:hypothetical protein